MGQVGVYYETYHPPLEPSHLLAVYLGTPLGLLPITDILLRCAFLDAKWSRSPCVPHCRDHRIRRLGGEDWRTVNVDGTLVTQKPSISRYESFCFVKKSGQYAAIYIQCLSSQAEILMDSVHFAVGLRCYCGKVQSGVGCCWNLARQSMRCCGVRCGGS